MSKGSRGKSTSKKPQKKKKANSRFQVIQDYKADGTVVQSPARFVGDFRLLRQMVRWAKRYGSFHDGYLDIYVSRRDIKAKRIWRTVNLARSIVSYRDTDWKIVINTLEPPENFKIKSDEEKFGRLVNHLRTHRLYGRAKLAPSPPNAAVEQVRSTDSQATASDSKDETDNLSKRDAKKDGPKIGKEAPNLEEQAQPSTRSVTGRTKQPPKKRADPLASRQPQKQLQPEYEKAPPTFAAPKPKTAPTPLASSKPSSDAIQEKKPQMPPFSSKQVSSTPTVEGKSPSAQKPLIIAQFVPSAPPGSALPGPSVGASSGSDQVALSKDDGKQEKAEDEPSDVTEQDDPVKRQSVPAPTYRQKLPGQMGPQPSIFRIAMEAIGRDVFQFSLPAAIMEPLSLLQTLCEELEYSELIDQAVSAQDPQTRMSYVACFAVSRYGSTAFRTGRKPFNPLLGQTFEHHCPHLGWRFIAEQVQHHPSVSACYAEGRGWRFWTDGELKVTFGGSSLEAKVFCLAQLHLEKWNETYKWNKVTSSVSGLLTGSFSLDHYGTMTIRCEETDTTATVQFKKRTRAARGEVDGKVMDKDDNVVGQIYGSWCDRLFAGDPDSDARCVWRLAALPPNHAKYYGMTLFALSLNEFRPEIHRLLPKTDTRYRPDQKALEMGKPSEADVIKKDLEGRQRKRRKEVEAGARPKHVPLWFKPTGNRDAMKGSRWTFNHEYWKAKESEFNDVTFLPLW